MSRLLLLIASALAASSPVYAQLVITSLTKDGKLAWTNSTVYGLYGLERSDSSAGPWNQFDLATNLNSICATSNRVAVEVPMPATPTFYRVRWTPPDPRGDWDYRGYDSAGTLVVTGTFTLAWLTNPPTAYRGWHDFKYVGPPTNNTRGWLGPQIGAGGIGGYLDSNYAHLGVVMPTNTLDDYANLSGTVWGNSYTGRWHYYTFVGDNTGPFKATRLPTVTSSSALLKVLQEMDSAKKAKPAALSHQGAVHSPHSK